MTKHISCDCKSKLIQHIIQIKNGIMKHVNVSVKIIVHTEKIIIRILAHIFASTLKLLLILQWSRVLKL